MGMGAPRLPPRARPWLLVGHKCRSEVNGSVIAPPCGEMNDVDRDRFSSRTTLSSPASDRSRAPRSDRRRGTSPARRLAGTDHPWLKARDVARQMAGRVSWSKCGMVRKHELDAAGIILVSACGIRRKDPSTSLGMPRAATLVEARSWPRQKPRLVPSAQLVQGDALRRMPVGIQHRVIDMLVQAGGETRGLDNRHAEHFAHLRNARAETPGR
jgi:hypothetical protein